MSLSAYFEARRSEYLNRLLAVSEHGAWEAWIEFFLEGVRVQARDAQQRARRLQDLRECYRRHRQSARAASRLLQVVDLLFARPLLSIPALCQELGVSFVAGQRYVQRLAAAGFLRESTGKARHRLFLAEEILRVVQEPIGPELLGRRRR